MKKQSKTTTVFRMNLEHGKYTTIARSILLNPNLTDPAKTLLQLCLNNTEAWKLTLTFYKKQLKWSNDKMSGAVENLIKEGYMTKEKKPNGGKKGFTYIYVISEYGNLNPNKEQPCITQIELSIQQESTVIEFKNEPDTAEIVSNETIENVPDEVSISTAQITEEDKDDFDVKVLTLIVETLNGHNTTQEYMLKCHEFYCDKYLINQQTLKTFDNDTELIRSSIKKNIEKKEAEARIKIDEWIDFHNSKGTIAQKKDIKVRVLRYFNEKWNFPMDEITEKDVSHRTLIYRTDILGANRVHDSRYQD